MIKIVFEPHDLPN